ncbi:hypothetical protein BDZ97DRAFT_1792384 [Flammula alnicola]|nr:hypothetical protein BDZ97DRAFT_1792384 [Flammula alnicola]
MQDQIAFDAATFLHAFRTLFEGFIKAPSLRLLLVDVISIASDLVSNAAAEVGRVVVEQAGGIEIVSDDIISQDAGGELKMEVSLDDVKNKGKEAADKITSAAQEVKTEWEGLEVEAADKTKGKILERMQEAMTRAQKDQAARSAIRAILILARKYADKIASASEIAEETIIDATRQAKDALNDAAAPNYPPQPCGRAHEKKPFIDITSDALLEDLKDMLQRIAQGHSLDGLLSAFARVVRDLDEVPLILGDEINETIEEKATQSATDVSPSSPSPSPPPEQRPKKGKKMNKKARMRAKKALGKEKEAMEKGSMLSPSESQDIEAPIGQETPEERSTSNPLRLYFSRIGTYMDKVLDEPGWVMSKDGSNTLEGLFDDGAELLNVVADVAVEVGEEIVDEKPPRPDPGKLKQSVDEKTRRKFRDDLKSLMDEAETYVSAVENDKTTINVLRAFDALGDDLSGFLLQGTDIGRRTMYQGIASTHAWTSWVGWAIPHLIRMLPRGAIPIPSIEAKTGNIEVALQALFVQGLARGNEDPVGSSLAPDEVVLQEWTEVRIDMAEQQRLPSGRVEPSSSSLSKPGVQTISRIAMHMDGVRAKIEGMGYYFKYTRGIIGYEDEGVLSVDVGMGSLHDGLALDMEVEIESTNTAFDSGVEAPEIIVEDPEEPANMNEQAAGATNGSAIELERAAIAAAVDAAEPLFRVVDVQVAMRGLRFKIDKSRHWILNKLFLQPLAGPVVARVVRQALQEKVGAALDVVSKGLGAVVKEAKQNGEVRLAKQRSDTVERAGSGLSEEEEPEEGLAEILSDWWRAILHAGPMVFGYDATTDSEGRDDAGEAVNVETTTRMDATTKGVVYTSTTTEQPLGTPAMVYNESTDTMERGAPQPESQEETVIAVGGGAQLFPGKAGPYGATDQGEERGILEQVRDTTNEGVNAAIRGLQEGSEAVENMEGRWDERSKEERRSKKTWKSKAFDF